MFAVVVASVWQSLGLWVVLVSAGLERIDPVLYEAARIDGANRWPSSPMSACRSCGRCCGP